MKYRKYVYTQQGPARFPKSKLNKVHRSPLITVAADRMPGRISRQYRKEESEKGHGSQQLMEKLSGCLHWYHPKVLCCGNRYADQSVVPSSSLTLHKKFWNKSQREEISKQY